MTLILIRYAEIALKGKNMVDFENQLISNIQKTLGIKKNQINKQNKQIVLSVSSSSIDKTKLKLAQVFGIAWFAPVQTCLSQLDKISKLALQLAKKTIKSSDSFAIRATRADKTLAFTSQELEIKIGDQIRKATKAKVNLSHPDKTIFISASKLKTYIYTEKISGPGGLPVNTSGKVLSLLSGGFDSIAASYLMAKRGAQVDFLHFHVFPDQKPVLKSKINTIVNKLSECTLSNHLFLTGYAPFQMAVLDLDKRLQRHELVVFRRLMARVGDSLAKKHNYQALVFGDSLGQVASQTMENITAVDQAVDIPIFRPLIGMDKLEIINLVKHIGLEKTTVLPYKDCCSIISSHPATRANLEKVTQIEENINIGKLVKQIASEADMIDTNYA